MLCVNLEFFFFCYVYIDDAALDLRPNWEREELFPSRRLDVKNYKRKLIKTDILQF